MHGDDDAVIDLVLGKLDEVRQQHGYWMARCPAHDDRKSSLSVKRGTEQPVILHCFADCHHDDILSAIGLTVADISKPREEHANGEWTPFGDAVAVYDYTDENGQLLYQVCRTADKQFPQRHPDVTRRSGWQWGIKGIRRVPYRLPAVIAAARDGRPIYIAEGEKDVHALERAGATATTSPGGAGKWRGDYDPYFAGADVIIIADADKPGRKHAAAVERHLRPVARTVRVVEAATGKDAADHLAAGHSLAELVDQPRAAARDTADPLPDEPKTELGYAKRLTAVYGDRLRYIPVWKRWLVWDGARWAHDTTGQSARWMKAIARRLTADALAIEDDAQRRAALALARRGESAAGISGALALAGTETGIALSPDDLDSDPALLNCANGTYDLGTGQLRGHDPADLITKITGAPYDPAADGPAFGTFLGRVQPDEAMRGYLARLTGHALEGRVTEHILPIFHGDGANGKGTYIGAVLAALGDYADAADPELLTARTFDAHPTGVADLFGLRLAVLHESDAGRSLAEGTVKRLTGGDRLKARRMREDFWHFEPSHTFVMLTNHKPVVTGQDEGIWRRLRLVPWDVVIPPEERDDRLGDRLRGEAAHILAWLIGGYQAWRQDGFADPDQVTTATATYRADSDSLGRFLDDRCIRGPHFHVRSSELYAAWAKWCVTEGVEAGSNKAFTGALGNRGYDTKRSRVGIIWDGIGLSEEE